MFMSVDFRLKLKWIFLITLQVRYLSGVTVDTGQCDCVPDSKPCTKEAVLISIASAFSKRAMACLPGMRLCCDARTSPRSHTKRLALTDHIRGFVLQIPNMVNRNRTKSRRQYLGVKGRSSSSISTFTEDAKNNLSKFETTTTTSLLDDNNKKNLKLLEVVRKHTNDGIKPTGEIDFMNPQLRPKIYDGFSYFKNESVAVTGFNESKVSPINQTLYAGITGRSKDEETKNKVNLSEESIMPCIDGKCIKPVINNTNSYIENIITVISMPLYFNYVSSHHSIENELHGSTVNPKSTEMFTSASETLFESNEGLQTFQTPSYESTKEHSLHQSEVYSVQVAESNVWTSSINILVDPLTITSSQFITNRGLSTPPSTTNYSTQFWTNSTFEKPSKVEALRTVEKTQSIVGQLSTEINNVSTTESEKTVDLMPSQIMSAEFETNSQTKDFFVGPTASLYNSYNSRPSKVESNVIPYLSITNTSEFLNPTEVSLLALSEVSSVYPATIDILSETLMEGANSSIDGSRTQEVDETSIKNITDEYHRNSISIKGTELKSEDKKHLLPMIYNTANPNSSVLLKNFESGEYTSVTESHDTLFKYSKVLSHRNINSSQNQLVSQSTLEMQNISGIVATPVWEMALKPNGNASNEEINHSVSVQDLNEDNLTVLENVTTAVPTQVANENFGYVPHQTVLMSSLHSEDKNVSIFVDNNSTVELVNLTVTTHTNDSFSAEGVETKNITDVTHGKGTLTYHLTHTPSLELSIHSSNNKFATETYSKGSEGLPEQFRNFLLPSTELAITESNVRFTTTKTYFIVLSPASTSSRLYSTERKHFHRYTSVPGYPQGSEMKYRPTFIKPSDNSQKEFNEYLQSIREESVKSKSGKDKKYFNWVFG